MPVKYIIVPYKIPSRPNDPVSYYPRLKASGEVDQRDIANRIADISTVSQADMMGAIEGMLQTIPRFLAEGNIVRLGEFGSFHLSVQAEGSPAPEMVNASRIKRSRLRFRPGKLVRKMLQDIEYIKTDV